MKVLIIFPNATNWTAISTAVPILSGIAVSRNWEIDYFDTYVYKNEDYISSEKEKMEKAGGFKKGAQTYNYSSKTYNDVVPDLQKKIDTFKPDLIAITALSNEYAFLITFFDKIKIPNNTKTIIGGIHCTVKPDEVINTKLFDLVALGEGEETFSELLIKLENNEDISDIKGTYFYNKSVDKIIKNRKRFLLPYDKLWAVKRNFSFFTDDYFKRSFDGKENRRYEVEISRGCPFNCTYCSNTILKEFNKDLGTYVKARPISSSIEEMKEILEKFKVDIFTFTDECFLSHKNEWLKEFLDVYKREINRPFILMTRAETITEQKMDIMMSYNIPFQVSIGVESGSDKILKEVCNRTATRDKIQKAFKILHQYKIRSNAFFIVGFPFETRSNVFETIDLCKKIKPSVASLAIFQPYPGQKLTNICIENKFIEPNVIPGVFSSDSLLNMPKPYLSTKEIKNIWRTFMLYAMLPKRYYKDIEKCEHDYHNNQKMFDDLLKLRWEKYDMSKINKDRKLV